MNIASTSNLRKIDWTLFGFLVMVSLMVWSFSTHHPQNTTKAAASVAQPTKHTRTTKECPTCGTSAEAMISLLQGQYMAKEGDNPFRIAVNHGISLEKFYGMNNMKPGQIIQPGQMFNVPKR